MAEPVIQPRVRTSTNAFRSEAYSNVDNGTDLRSVLVLLWIRRWWLLLSIAVSLAGVTALAFLTTPIYRASVVMVPAFPSGGTGLLGSALGQLNGLASLVGVNVNTMDSQTEEALAVLQSRSFTEQFIVEKKLMPVLFADKWDSARDGWRGKPPTLARAFRYFDKKVRTVIEDKKTGLVTVRVDWRDGVAAAQWANELVARLNAEMRSRAINEATADLQYLRSELATSSEVEVREAINRLIETQINQRMLADVTQEYAFRVVDRALPADPTDPLWPKRTWLLVGGAVFGLLIGIFVVLFHQMMARQ